jgi:arginine decarboxylase
VPDRLGPDITIRTGTGSGRTRLSAFDAALMAAGVADHNLITLSSVIPPRSRVRVAADPLDSRHGDRLFCVLSVAHADLPGETAWAGLGWTHDDAAGGLFVEHAAGSEESLLEQIELTLGDMVERRTMPAGPVRSVTASAHCTDRPVCAVAVAAYEVLPWGSRA